MESCTATEIRCATNVSQVRADHVVSSYSEEVSLLLRSTQPHGQLPVAQSRTPVSAGDRPPNVSASSGTYSTPTACLWG